MYDVELTIRKKQLIKLYELLKMKDFEKISKAINEIPDAENEQKRLIKEWNKMKPREQQLMICDIILGYTPSLLDELNIEEDVELTNRAIETKGQILIDAIKEETEREREKLKNKKGELPKC